MQGMLLGKTGKNKKNREKPGSSLIAENLVFLCFSCFSLFF